MAGCTTLRPSASTPKPVDALARSVGAKRIVVVTRQDRRRRRRISVGADKGYDTKKFVACCRAMNVTPHVAMNETKYRASNVDGRTVDFWGLQDEPMHPKAHRGVLGLDEDDRQLPTEPIQGSSSDCIPRRRCALRAS